MTGDIKKPVTGQPSSFSQQEPTQQSLQRREQIPQLAQGIAARRGIEVPKGVRLQHIGNYVRNQAAQQARLQQIQRTQPAPQQPQTREPSRPEPQTQPQQQQPAQTQPKRKPQGQQPQM
jgi:hypothetical protein